jgi:hypothetical protein
MTDHDGVEQVITMVWRAHQDVGEVVARELEDEAAMTMRTVTDHSEFPSVSTIDTYIGRRLSRLFA